MDKIQSGINDLDHLIDSLHVGDNVVWDVESGTAFEIFIQSFIHQSFSEGKNVIYVSFNKSPHSILRQIQKIPSENDFVLLDCFTSGKGKNDRAFVKFYDNNTNPNIIRVDDPRNIEYFTSVLNSLEDKFQSGGRYVFDSLTGMQDLWGDENSTYKFFTYICPRLYDLGTVAYWILEKNAHSQKFKANLRHITQVVLELYRRKEKFWIKSQKLEGRTNREAFKPHSYEIEGRDISIGSIKKEPTLDIGSRLKQIRIKAGISQKDLAAKVDLTPSFISQLENNQISPSLNSIILLCSTLGINLSDLLEEKKTAEQWLITRESISSGVIMTDNGMKGFSILKNNNFNAVLIRFEPNTTVRKDFLPPKSSKFIYVLKGPVSVVLDGKKSVLRQGDAAYFKEIFPSEWKTEGGDKAEILLLSS
jgi:transcriptional regulator with XRE-family HTH domain